MLVQQQRPPGETTPETDNKPAIGSLRTFHMVFISVAALFGAGMGAWSLFQFATEGGAGSLVMGVCTLILAAGLVWYGRWFLMKMKHEHIA